MPNKTKGFSFIKFILLTAIVALVVVFAGPEVLSFIDKKQAEKDDEKMSEVVNVIELAITDQNIFDELVYYTCSSNYSCYVDGDSMTNTVSNRISGTGKSAFDTYSDETRLIDGKAWMGAGHMRGVTITFNPVHSETETVFPVSNAIVNDMFSGNASKAKEERGLTYSNSPRAVSGALLSTVKAGSSNNTYLYNRIRSTVGDNISLTSSAYKNSSYTVFVHIDFDGNPKTDSNMFNVYGQWNGMHLGEE